MHWLSLYIGGEMIPIRVERDLLNGFLFESVSVRAIN
jgi:hypothetical protein